MFSLTRSSCLQPLRRASITSLSLCRQHSTIFEPQITVAHAKLKSAEEQHIKTLLAFLLRPFAGRAHGLPVRDDGFLSVKSLFKHPQFRSMSFPQLEGIVLSDLKHRFVLTYDPKQPEDPWWLRVKYWNEKNIVLRPVAETDTFRAPVIYTTTLTEWQDHISKAGIIRGSEDYIHLTLGQTSTSYLTSPPTSSPIVHIHVHTTQALKDANVQFFLAGAKPQDPQTILTMYTKGDVNGVISPKYFSKVEIVTVEKRLLFGKWEDQCTSSHVTKSNPLSPYPIADPHLDPATGRRRTFARIPDANVREYVDMGPIVGQWKLPITAHAITEQQQEARDVLGGA